MDADERTKALFQTNSILYHIHQDLQNITVELLKMNQMTEIKETKAEEILKKVMPIIEKLVKNHT